MEKQEIILGIESRVLNWQYTNSCTDKEKYACWYIGITNDPDRRRAEHGQENNVKAWACWEAKTENDARDIEKLFIDRGMKGGEGGGNPEDKPNYVYVF